MMLSRIADALYWLDRYMERTDGILRTLRTEYVLSLDKSGEGTTSWRPVLHMFTQAAEDELAQMEFNTTESLRYIISDTANTNSLRALLTRARENARGAQDHITKEVWEQVNHVYHSVNAPAMQRRLQGPDALPLLDELTQMITLYKGVTDSTMPRSQGWSFMNLGKFVERCMLTLEMTDRYLHDLDYNLDEHRDILYWRKLLLSLSGYEMHLKTYRNAQHTYNVADQVFFNPHFTRSIRYALDKIDNYLRDVTDINNPAEKERLCREFGRLRYRVEYADLDLVKQVEPKQFLQEIRAQLIHFNKLLTQVFFSYA